MNSPSYNSGSEFDGFTGESGTHVRLIVQEGEEETGGGNSGVASVSYGVARPVHGVQLTEEAIFEVEAGTKDWLAQAKICLTVA